MLCVLYSLPFAYYNDFAITLSTSQSKRPGMFIFFRLPLLLGSFSMFDPTPPSFLLYGHDIDRAYSNVSSRSLRGIHPSIHLSGPCPLTYAYDVWLTYSFDTQ